MSEKLLLWIAIVIALIISGIIGYLIGHRKANGIIYVEPVEDDPERDRIRFILDMDLDTIKKQPQIVFRVEDKTSQKLQSV